MRGGSDKSDLSDQSDQSDISDLSDGSEFLWGAIRALAGLGEPAAAELMREFRGF